MPIGWVITLEGGEGRAGQGRDRTGPPLLAALALWAWHFGLWPWRHGMGGDGQTGTGPSFLRNLTFPYIPLTLIL